ncbi:hypothetical protein GOV06_02750 [Candidatus Woesearchaeota archaeon]|nr:hypothetical protein [Candidatus Woesearchaeota archaeon]
MKCPEGDYSNLNEKIDTEKLDQALDNLKKREGIEDCLGEAKSERNKSFLKAVGGVALPVAVLSGVATFTHYAFESSDLATLLTLGVGFGLGVTIGYDYVDMVKEFFCDFKDGYYRVRQYAGELQVLDAKAELKAPDSKGE